ncbi:hypothetical protein GMDG_03120 [Pseudogymnoascus destructans 20631-21]|uniref:Uncharacterized protein n=2 Tax=Pseudogymnoascus destructans TaxID=655981 RepID=L8G4W6_PSED2|nr:hypothetical protein GMDG_03120 [Pseudogymnoascus destructans 20631-21]
MSINSGLFDGSLPFPRSPRNGSLHTPPSISSNSRANSLWEGDADEVHSKKHAVMVSYLHGRIASQMWFDVNKEFLYTPAGSGCSNSPISSYDRTSVQGVLLRTSRGVYVTQPSNLCHNLIAAVQRLNVEVAFTMSTELTNLIFSTITPNQTEFILPHDSTQYQILDSFEDMAKASSNKLKRFQYTCFVRKERVVLLWHDDVESILSHGDKVERQLLTVIWGAKIPALPNSTSSHNSMLHSPFHAPPTNSSTYALPIKAPSAPQPSIRVSLASRLGFTSRQEVEKGEGVVNADEKDVDVESNVPVKESLERPLVFISAIFVGMALCLMIILLLGFGASALLYECLMDGSWMRMALLATVPFFGLFGLFFAICIFTDLFQVIGPIRAVTSNSRCYSSIRPDIFKAYQIGFRPSHITIQMPVYKEGLDSVIIPTVTSLKAAISHYELNGGTASIFINDDGLQLLPEDEAQARRDFYTDNNIGWVARPKHGVDGFVRGGKFKKASNMNFALNISNKTEDVLTEMIEIRKSYTNGGDITESEQDELYKAALDKVLDDDGKAWADGDIRMGEYILIIDSDTRVPVDCLLYGAAEMFLSPEVAIVQHSAGVMQVVGDYFENGITFFTNQIYSAIRFAVGCGEAAPFVGHNAFLRWQAIQSVASKAPDGSDLFWSESHVSEDFDISLRVQMAGNFVRLATYHGDEFKEGVSLTVYDELSRWEKYAFGCNELVFNPLYTWLWKSPFTPLFRKLIWSNMQMSSKTTILAYIATYYALAFGLPLTILNYFLIGWENGYIDSFYIESWKIFVALLVVFSGLGNVCLAILRYRLGEKSLLGALLENFMWMPMFAVFFGGISFHLFLALCAHMFSINMEWGATAKEAVASNFFKEVPKIFKSFKWMYAFTIPVVGGMIYLGKFAPAGYDISIVTAIVPLAVMLSSHILLPFMLNPALMILKY